MCIRDGYQRRVHGHLITGRFFRLGNTTKGEKPLVIAKTSDLEGKLAQFNLKVMKGASKASRLYTISSQTKEGELAFADAFLSEGKYDESNSSLKNEEAKNAIFKLGLGSKEPYYEIKFCSDAINMIKQFISTESETNIDLILNTIAMLKNYVMNSEPGYIRFDLIYLRPVDMRQNLLKKMKVFKYLKELIGAGWGKLSIEPTNKVLGKLASEVLSLVEHLARENKKTKQKAMKMINNPSVLIHLLNSKCSWRACLSSILEGFTISEFKGRGKQSGTLFKVSEIILKEIERCSIHQHDFLILKHLALALTKRNSEDVFNWLNNLGIKSAWDAICLLYTSPSPRDATLSRMPSSA
eukprot:TRINITY_DN8847_c0_g1_i1.p1 TRINITY_DN8847_c0_g1~~TRINITY_DN8847_c0_g1_i1.p1  ORF type:complete len:361 (-),score=75.49 TRINITY_DN8847_c0_g1_i1:14-1075(-)